MDQVQKNRDCPHFRVAAMTDQARNAYLQSIGAYNEYAKGVNQVLGNPGQAIQNYQNVSPFQRAGIVVGGLGLGLSMTPVSPGGIAKGIWTFGSKGPQVIDGIRYLPHALERMIPAGFGGRGVPPSVIENAIKYGTKTESYGNTVVHTYDNVQVVTNSNKDVITVILTGR